MTDSEIKTTGTKPVISVIVLTYNQEHNIADTLDCILKQQTSVDYEIVIGEDASTDATREVCERYAADYPDKVRLLPKSPNKGVVRNYFDALASCRGELIADCAGDDLWSDRQFLQRHYDLLNDNPLTSMTFAAWTKVYPDGRRVAEDYGLTQPTYFTGHSLLERYLSHETMIVLSTSLYRLNRLKVVMTESPDMVDNPDFGCEDLPVICALLSKGDAIYTPVAALDYGVGDDSITNPRSMERAAKFYSRALETTCILARHYGVNTLQLHRYCSAQLNYVISLALRIKDNTILTMARRLSHTYGLSLNLKSRLRVCLHLTSVKFKSIFRAIITKP